MLKRLLSFLFLMLIISSNTFAQDLKSKLDLIVKKYYPNENDPGIVLKIEDKKNSLHYTSAVGLANLEKNIKLTDSSNFRMASVSKQFTALAISYLEGKRKLKYSQKIGEFFPNLKPKVAKITINQLLTHSSGIADYEALLTDNISTQLSDQDVLNMIEPIDSLYFQPGTKFRYSNTGYCLLSLIVEKVSGKKYSDFMKTDIFDSYEMNNTFLMDKGVEVSNRVYGYHPVDGKFKFADQSITSATKGDGGVYTSAKDYFIYLDKKELVFDKLIKALKNKQNLTKYLFPIKGNTSYHMGLFVIRDKFNNPVLVHSGESTGFHNIVLNDQTRGLKISLFSNRDDLLIADCFDEILKALHVDLNIENRTPLFTYLSNIYANKY